MMEPPCAWMWLPLVSSQVWPGRIESYSGMRTFRLGEKRALRAGQRAGLAGHFEGARQPAVIGVQAHEELDVRRLDRELARGVRVAELGRFERERDAARLVRVEADAAEAGQLLGGAGDAGGIHPYVELHDRGPWRAAGVGDGRVYADAAAGVGLRISV